MSIKQSLIDPGKLLLCSLAFILGAVSGGMVAALLGLQQPPIPEGVDSSLSFLLLLLESPVMAFALALVATGLAGGLLPRALILSFFTWVTYTLNTAIESLAFTITTVVHLPGICLHQERERVRHVHRSHCYEQRGRFAIVLCHHSEPDTCQPGFDSDYAGSGRHYVREECAPRNKNPTIPIYKGEK